MELIYTPQTSQFDPNKHYRNPLYFEKAERQASKVIVVGDFPDVINAYQQLGVTVEQLGESQQTAETPQPPQEPKKSKSAKGAKNEPTNTE